MDRPSNENVNNNRFQKEHGLIENKCMNTMKNIKTQQIIEYKKLIFILKKFIHF